MCKGEFVPFSSKRGRILDSCLSVLNPSIWPIKSILCRSWFCPQMFPRRRPLLFLLFLQFMLLFLLLLAKKIWLTLLLPPHKRWFVSLLISLLRQGLHVSSAFLSRCSLCRYISRLGPNWNLATLSFFRSVSGRSILLFCTSHVSMGRSCHASGFHLLGCGLGKLFLRAWLAGYLLWWTYFIILVLFCFAQLWPRGFMSHVRLRSRIVFRCSCISSFVSFPW